MEETIKALRAGSSQFDYDDHNWILFPGMPLPPKIKIPDFERGAYYSHLLVHTFSFSDLIEAGKKLDMGVKLGRIVGPSRKKDRETSKKQTVGTSRRGKDTTIGTVNSERQTSQPISVDYTPAPQTSQGYAHPMHYTQFYPAELNKVDPRLRDLLSRLNVLQPRELNRAMLLNRIRASSTPLYQLFPPKYLGSFSQAIRSKQRCPGAPGHTLDNYWRLRDKIQEMIDTRQISLNEVKQLNVHVNPPPDNGSGLGPSINMISIAAIGEEEEDVQVTPVPFIIHCTPAEVVATSAPFVIEVPAKEPYQDHQVPWNYGGEVANTR
ncbi:hypothetical protein CRG98_026394 [Punica granatum]|uniref:Uncharacterized protein n=1 Tax=Punica granatum TaxID=22663 RepID=A0A2I0JB08_PUNGR|nr:hypothetical protein CRG98_026394 [Punica granatum]